MAKTIYHALTFNSQVPPTKEESNRTTTPEKVWTSIRKYREFRGKHDPLWEQATDHPTALYRFFGLNDDEVLKWFGEPPERQTKDSDYYKDIDKQAKDNVISLLSRFEKKSSG